MKYDFGIKLSRNFNREELEKLIIEAGEKVGFRKFRREEVGVTGYEGFPPQRVWRHHQTFFYFGRVGMIYGDLFSRRRSVMKYVTKFQELSQNEVR